MMLPPRPERCMCGSTARVVRKAPSRWMASIFFQSEKGNSSSGCTIWMPALLTSTSTPSHARTTAATAASTCSSRVTSIATASALPPLRVISSATAWAASLFRSAIATRAPSRAKRRAISLPMPLAAPVTMQILLRRFMVEDSVRGGSSGAVRARQIEHPHAVRIGGAAPGPARIAQRLQDIGAPGLPVLAHREPREFVVLGVVLVALRAIDELDDVQARGAGAQDFKHVARVGVGLQLGRQLAHEPHERRGGAPALDIDVRIEPGTAREADVLLALGDALHARRQEPARREKVDLEDDALTLARLVDQVVERGVRSEPAIPVELAVDFQRRESGRQRAARHDVAHVQALRGRIEISHVAGAHVDRANREAKLARVEAVEVDQPLERVLEQRGVVVADGADAAARLQRRRRKARCEESGHAEQQRLRGREAVEPAVHLAVR